MEISLSIKIERGGSPLSIKYFIALKGVFDQQSGHCRLE